MQNCYFFPVFKAFFLFWVFQKAEKAGDQNELYHYKISVIAKECLSLQKLSPTSKNHRL